MRILLFTDIDGTLIDHHTYSTRLAKEALILLARWEVTVVFCSSKTFDEQWHLQNKMGISTPFILENGSAIICPKYFFSSRPVGFSEISDKHYQLTLAQGKYSEIRRILHKINDLSERKLLGYADFTDREIAEFTGLEGRSVTRAKNRWFTETLLSGTPQPEDLRILNEAGFCTSRGGRFFTVQDKEVSKGKAVKLLVELLEKEWKEKVMTLGIGDSPNDTSFLNTVNKAFLVQKHDGSWAKMEIPGLTKIGAIGPRGFLALANNIQDLMV
jgi:mannosyl-3-phosphoglycerate phosphatase family protein